MACTFQASRRALGLALAVVLALGGCGGGSEEPAPSPTPGPPTPAPPPTPSPSPSSSDRIEPLDTATLKQALSVERPATAASRLVPGTVVPQVRLDPLQGTQKQAGVPRTGAPLQIGVNRPVDATASATALSARLHWSRLPDDTQVAALAFTSPQARAIRLGLRVGRLPAGAVLRFYGAAGSPVLAWSEADLASWHSASQASGSPPDTDRVVWAPDTPGPVSTLEIQLPPQATPAELQLAVPALSHLTRTVEQAAEPEIGAAGSCTLDVMCAPELDAESRSVARILFTRQGASYLCTGTLLNDTRGSRTPHFLTAAHCIADAESAASVVTYWFFRAAGCNRSPAADPAAVQITGGARLLFTDATVDGTLLQLNVAPPPRVVYAGSYFGDAVVPGTPVMGISQPGGDLQRYAVGTITDYATCRDDVCSGSAGAASPMWQVVWTRGVTEPGSSGSAIWMQAGNTRYVAGALYGGSSSCQNPRGADYFGRFGLAYQRGIGQWLNR